MKRFSSLLCFLVCLSIISPFVYSQSKESGALKGTIMLEDGKPISGVLVTLTSDQLVGATKTTISGTDGQYRFVGLQTGIYTITASLEGFTSAKQTGIQVHIGKTFTVDLMLKQGKITEEVQVVGRSALVDVKDSSTASVEMTTEFLQNVPNAQFTTDAVNLAPGIHLDVAYGAASGNGIVYQIDGVDVSDPGLGTAWVFLDYDVVDEASISGVGAPAEYGGFTGVVYNTVTKSGGNQFKGYSEFLYQDKSWNSKNSSDPQFAPGKVSFYTGHLDFGGPIIKDKLSFFLAGLYYRTNEKLSGTDYNRDYKQPKGFFKLTWQPSKETRINSFVEVDTYNGTGRRGGANTTKDATLNQKSPEVVANLSAQQLFSDYTFMEAKLAYFWGYFALDPVNGKGVSGHIDLGTGMHTVNNYYYYRADRTRLQANLSVTHHADDFIKGSHDFKFGTDMMFMTERDQYGFNGGAYYLDVYGAPYYKTTYEGYDTHTKMSTFGFYAQDSWTIGKRLTINPGLRIDTSRGYVTDRPDEKYITKPSIAPRIGLTFDILGDHTTAFKAHWGRYFAGTLGLGISRLAATQSDRRSYFWDGTEWVENPYAYIPGHVSQYDIDGKVKQSYMDQLTFGLERQMMKDLSIGVTYIHRRNYDQIAGVNFGGQYVAKQWTDPATGEVQTVWTQINPSSENHYIITNPKAGMLPWITTDPFRKYDGIEFLVNKRFSKRWQMMLSYVYSKTTGNINNSNTAVTGTTAMYANPNNQINAIGRLTDDPTHMLKIQGSVILPLDINLNVNFELVSGETYTKTIKLPSSIDFNRTEIFAEPRGSYRLPATHTLNLRLEKTFTFSKVKLGFLLDVFNVLNEGKKTDVETLYNIFSQTISIENPRAFRAGIRFWF